LIRNPKRNCPIISTIEIRDFRILEHSPNNLFVFIFPGLKSWAGFETLIEIALLFPGLKFENLERSKPGPNQHFIFIFPGLKSGLRKLHDEILNPRTFKPLPREERFGADLKKSRKSCPTATDKTLCDARFSIIGKP
jgi:hypothetical protein